MRIFAVTVSVLLLAGCGSAAVPVKPGAATEFLKVAPYPSEPAWKKITDKSNADGSIMEWIPADQDENDIKDILTVQVFKRLAGRDPQKFLQGMVALSTKTCGDVRYSGKAHPEMSPPLSYMQIFCSFPGGQHEEVDMYIKAISGNDALYVVQREFHYPKEAGPAGVNTFNKDQVSTMVAMLKQVGVTNKFLDDAVYVCPVSGGGPAGCTDGSPNAAAPTP